MRDIRIARASVTPRHDGHRRDRVLWRAFDYPVADCDIDQGISSFVDRAEDMGVLKEKRRAFGVDFFIGWQF